MPFSSLTLASVFPDSHRSRLTSKVTWILTFFLLSSSLE